MASLPQRRFRPEREWAKARLREFGIQTSRFRAPPDFLVIGAKRGGTTSMQDYLGQHPDVLPLFPRRQNIKGVHFFDSNFDRGVAWYRSHFPTEFRRAIHRARTGHSPLVGDASPYYLFHPLVPARAHQTVPSAKIIVLLRNPIDRAYSHFRERVQHNAEPLSFREAIDNEAARLAGEEERIIADPGYRSWPHENHSYLAQSMYLPALRRWMSFFPRGQFHIMLSEDMYADPLSVFQKSLDFLGLSPFTGVRFPKRNFNPGPPLEADLRGRLTALFADHNRELAEFLDLDLGSWDAG